MQSEGIYRRLAPIYDFVYGKALDHGRLRALETLRLCPGESVLEIGVGTGAMLPLYPEGVRVSAVEISAPMLARAQARFESSAIVAEVSLARMDAARLAFASDAFDLVFAGYVINAVDDPGAGRTRDEARLPAGRTTRVPQPLPQRASGVADRRTLGDAAHPAFRVPLGPAALRSALGGGSHAALVDSGERPEPLAARRVSGLTRPDARASPEVCRVGGPSSQRRCTV